MSLPLDRAIDLVEGGASFVQVEIPELIVGEVDDELAEAIVALIGRLVHRQAEVRDDDGVRPLDPTMIGVVCAHVAQVNAVRERLPKRLAGVFVETADRFQGLERSIMVVHHPLSGRADASEFHLDVGRLCVMLSRHRVACFVIARAAIEELLLRHAPSGDRILGADDDAEFEGWRAHVTILQELRGLGRAQPLAAVGGGPDGAQRSKCSSARSSRAWGSTGKQLRVPSARLVTMPFEPRISALLLTRPSAFASPGCGLLTRWSF